jgi:hypothetical protein
MQNMVVLEYFTEEKIEIPQREEIDVLMKQDDQMI